MKKALLIATAMGMSLAYAGSSYRVTLYRPTNVNGTELKAGECKLEIEDGKAILKQGKTKVEAPVKVETRSAKFDSTTVGYNGDSANNQIQEIRLGGTNTMLLFTQPAKALAADGSR
jgi:hypothetical protein